MGVLCFYKEVNDLIKKCLNIDEEERINLENIISHTWLNTTKIEESNIQPQIMPNIENTIHSKTATTINYEDLVEQQNKNPIDAKMKNNKDEAKRKEKNFNKIGSFKKLKLKFRRFFSHLKHFGKILIAIIH